MVEFGGEANLGKGEHNYTIKTLPLAFLLRYLLITIKLVAENNSPAKGNSC